MRDKEELAKYFKLMEAYPQEFVNSGTLHIVTDKRIIRDFVRRTGNRIGVLYESPYRMLVTDLVYNEPGQYFTYERMFPFGSGVGVVCVPKYKDKYLLLKQYRHAMRDYQYGFPRGYGEDGLSGARNAVKELREEIGAESCEAELIGSVILDSGLFGKPAEIYLCEVGTYEPKIGYEDIVEVLEVSWEELTGMIGEKQITDGYTLSAYSLLAVNSRA